MNHVMSWQPFWIREQRNSGRIELLKIQIHAHVVLWWPSWFRKTKERRPYRIRLVCKNDSCGVMAAILD